MNFEVYGASDIGCARALNEDSFCVYGFDQNETSFCILSDGMGGHNAGEVASQKTVQFMSEELIEILQDTENPSLPKEIHRAVQAANAKVYHMADVNQSQQGMGATLVMAMVLKNIAYIANVGDSRAYAYRRQELMQITRDHSVVEEMVANGSITREEAKIHPQRNIITRAVGTDPLVEPDVFEYEYLPGDVLLLCSDGLSTMVEDEEILEIIKEKTDAKETVEALIEKAKSSGGRDNITAICVRFIQEV